MDPPEPGVWSDEDIRKVEIALLVLGLLTLMAVFYVMGSI
jgi:hypothetical protein